MNCLLSLHDVSISGNTPAGSRIIVDSLSMQVSEGESLALVGESGSGKSITALAVMGLLPEGEVTIRSGSIEFAGTDLRAISGRERRRITGADMAMIFQEPMTSLNPVMRVGDQITEMILAHERVGRRAALARARDLLTSVQMPEPELRLRAYPHQLSGGQRQRVMIAIALACRPRLLIADEPTTALDVTVQAHILALLKELQRELNMAMLFITHDLGVVANIADRVSIMYCGRISETGSVRDIFRSAVHPYTNGLLACMPSSGVGRDELTAIPGQLPTPSDPVLACRFSPRCAHADANCRRVPTPTVTIADGHHADCHHVSRMLGS